MWQLNSGRRYTKRSCLLTGLIECGACGADGKPCGAKLFPGATKAQREEAPKRRYRCFKFDATGQPYGCGKVTRLADLVELAVSEAVLAAYEGEDLAALVAPDAPVGVARGGRVAWRGQATVGAGQPRPVPAAR